MPKQPAPLGTVLREDYQAVKREWRRGLERVVDERDKARAERDEWREGHAAWGELEAVKSERDFAQALLRQGEPLASAREVADELERERDRALAALREIAITTCREWVEDKNDRCNAPAEFVLWGKLIDAEGLGPRCYDHAAQHVGHRALGDKSWAIIDLRSALAALSNQDKP